MDHSQDKNLSQLMKERENIVPIRSNPELDKIVPVYHNELIVLKPKPLENVLNPWLPENGIAFIYAASGVGKTLFTLNVAYAIAGGGSFLKFKAPLQKKVLYIDAEMSFSIMHNRYLQTSNQQGELYDPKNFCLLSHELIRPFKLPKISDAEGQDFYNRFIEKTGVEVIIFDNLSMLAVWDENIAQQWNFIQDWLVSLRAKGKTCIMVHHSGKEAQGYRGTSKMIDCADTAISLQNVSQTQSEAQVTNCKKFKIEYQKNRTFGGQEALSFEAYLDSSGWRYESLEKSNEERIVEMVELKIKPNDIATDLKIGRSTVYRLIKSLRMKGLIRD